MRPARSRVLFVAVVAALLATCTTAAGAGAANAGASTAASLCSVAKGVADSFVHPPSAKTLSSSQGIAEMKTNIGKVLAAKGRLVSATPGSLKKDMRQALGFLALANSDLASIKWNLAALAARPAMAASLEASETRSGPSFDRLRGYFTKTCHFK